MVLSPARRVDEIAPWVRVLIMLSALLVGAFLSYRYTGSTIPVNNRDALLFQNGLLLVVLGSALIEFKFTKPADVVVNALMGVVTLIPVYYGAPTTAWWVVFGYCATVFVLGIVCVAASAGTHIAGLQRTIAERTYILATFLGPARVIYSILFLFGLFGFHELRSTQTVGFLLFWGAFVVIWPLKVPELLSRLSLRSNPGPERVGRIVRFDWPNVVRLAIASPNSWRHDRQKLFRQSDGTTMLVVPLYAESNGEEFIGTGICVKASDYSAHLEPGCVYEASQPQQLSSSALAAALGADETSELIGFVIEDSEIARIRFETWDINACREGMLVFAQVAGERIYYQVIDGYTREESFQSHRHGYQVAIAAQVGAVKPDRGFVKFTWLPSMNAPIFRFEAAETDTLLDVNKSDFQFGHMPESSIPVVGDFITAIDHHTAILGVTGSGKTELALDLIRHAASRGVKVICVDLTARYGERLKDVNPRALSLSAELTEKLAGLLFDVETGSYGAGAEKKTLKRFSDELRADIRKSLDDFLKASDMIGLITLEEISNTKATLAITEMFLGGVLQLAKERSRASQRILVALEEAHTVVPEASTMGVADYESKGLVGKIAQIALQGRKYGVGLLVIAQRTATVSKSILTQCGTVISFTCSDETSLGFLGNVFGSSYAGLIPNLPPLDAIAFGKGIRSQRPVIVRIPYRKEKAEAAAKADGRDLTHENPLGVVAPVGAPGIDLNVRMREVDQR